MTTDTRDPAPTVPQAAATRRAVLLAAAATLSRPLIAQTRPRVVVVGGGPAGLAAARVLAGAGQVDLLLIEQQRRYRAPWTFNATLGGLADPAHTARSYQALPAQGIAVRHGTALRVDVDARVLHLADGDAVPWDRLILAPGIAMQPGAPSHLHAWSSEAGVDELANALDAVPDGGQVVIVTPPLPMRCPPAPYERASMIAHRLRSTGRGNAHITILDAKETGALLALFQAGWEANQPGMVEWLPPSIHGGIERLDATQVVTGLDTLRADLVCAIPQHRAADLAQPFADATGWCTVDPLRMRSGVSDRIYIAGDAAALSPVPRSAVAAAASGRIAAASVLSDLGLDRSPPPPMENLCWGRLAPSDAVRSTDTYRMDATGIQVVMSAVSSPRDPAATRAATFAAADRWNQDFLSALFGNA